MWDICQPLLAMPRASPNCLQENGVHFPMPTLWSWGKVWGEKLILGSQSSSMLALSSQNTFIPPCVPGIAASLGQIYQKVTCNIGREHDFPETIQQETHRKRFFQVCHLLFLSEI